jgi:hypothetical protein
MRTQSIAAAATLAIVVAAIPVQAGSPLGADEPRQRLAFSLDEMNCISSDVGVRAEVPATSGSDGTMRLAGESDGGTNGIPCDRRDPKAPPHRRSQS